MVRFDAVLPAVVRLVEEAGASALERCCLVRDLRGQVRLVLELRPGAVLDIKALEQRLQHELQRYFAPPIWRMGEPGESRRLAQKLCELSEPWQPEDIEHPLTGVRRPATQGLWRKLERRLSKQIWLDDGSPEPPWRLDKGAKIVTFYSFKGGVGRTTALVSCAWQLARAGKQVAVIDLDLEAPGLGALVDAAPGPGVIDFIVDWLATDKSSLEGLHRPALALGAEAERVTVLPAGRLDPSYLEKLARLDFLASGLGGTEKSPVEQALKTLLCEVAYKLEPRPDYLLVDSRAGLHDLAGLSLHGLAHVDVILGRASEQGYAGLELTLRTLGRRKKKNLQCVVVHALAPRDPSSPQTEEEERAFRQRSYRIFGEHIYPSDRDQPDEVDSAARHYPVVLRQDQALERFVALAGNDEVERALFSGPYRALLDRIDQLCQPLPEESQVEEEG